MKDTVEGSGKREQEGRDSTFNCMENTYATHAPTFLGAYIENQMKKNDCSGNQKEKKSLCRHDSSAANLKTESPLRMLERINADSTV